MNALLENLGYPARILAIIVFIVGLHLMVILVRAIGSKLMVLLPRGTLLQPMNSFLEYLSRGHPRRAG